MATMFSKWHSTSQADTISNLVLWGMSMEKHSRHWYLNFKKQGLVETLLVAVGRLEMTLTIKLCVTILIGCIKKLNIPYPLVVLRICQFKVITTSEYSAEAYWFVFILPLEYRKINSFIEERFDEENRNHLLSMANIIFHTSAKAILNFTWR